jgi:U1 small nuclear ribonucleoprotein
VVLNQKTGKSRGYGFVTFESEKDCKAAYNEANGKMIERRRIVVDMERGRTRKDWLPRRLGGGKGQTRKAEGVEKLVKQVKSELPPIEV